MRPPNGQHLLALDGLRGIAILLVMLGHFDEAGALVVTRLGWTGVDLFFVLSGYLITGILLRTRDASNYYSAFFGRRALRIFPLYYVALFLILVVFPRATGASAAEHPWQFWFYLSNFGIVFLGWPPVALSHFWSLAVEEHFYFAWPFVVRTLGPLRLLPFATAAILAVVVLRCSLVVLHVPWPACHYLTPCRADSLMVGAAIATLQTSERGRELLSRWRLPVLCVSALFTVAMLRVAHETMMISPVVRSVGYTVLASFYGSVVVLATGAGRVARALEAAPLRFLGKYSYGAYVAHVPLMMAFRGHLDGGGVLLTLARSATLTLATFAVAFVSWHLFEKRFLGMKPEYRQVQPTALSAVKDLPAVDGSRV